MSNSTYRMILGSILLVSLYVDIDMLIFTIIAVMLFEGVTNWRIPIMVDRMRRLPAGTSDGETSTRFNFEAERAWRLMLGGMILVTYLLGQDSLLWFFPWALGIVLLGAGVSGFCVSMLLFKWLGFR